MTRWEYFTVVTLSDEQLNRLGEEGWELVAIDMQNRKFFKREDESAPSPRRFVGDGYVVDE